MYTRQQRYWMPICNSFSRFNGLLMRGVPLLFARIRVYMCLAETIYTRSTQRAPLFGNFVELSPCLVALQSFWHRMATPHRDRQSVRKRQYVARWSAGCCARVEKTRHHHHHHHEHTHQKHTDRRFFSRLFCNFGAIVAAA